MPILGAHMSIAGGYYKAVEAAAGLGMNTVQLFTKNNNQWRAKPIDDDEVRRFREAATSAGIGPIIAHNSYLINLASPADEMWRKSIDAMVEELRRAALLGIPHVVTHPGSHLGAGEEAGIARVAAGLDAVFERQPEGAVALEVTAGQGDHLGWRLEHLARIREQCKQPERVGYCLDTCHLLAAGYPLSPKRQYTRTMAEIADVLGTALVAAIHVNDSKKPLGSRVDRHEHIGKGCLGLEPFQLLLRDRRWRRTPLILETPKGTDPATGRDWDAINLATLRSLLEK